MKISIIIPVYNEAANIQKSLSSLQWLREKGHEIIVVDGGSTDQSLQLANSLSDHVISSPKGRAQQMNLGAKLAQGDVYLFLHVDTLLTPEGVDEILNRLTIKDDQWGRFNVRLSGGHFFFRVIEWMMNWRSRITGIATGDQAIFITKSLFEKVKGYADIPLMEDIDICRRLKIYRQPLCLKNTVITSSRRWEANGLYRTVWLMWRLRCAYWLGVKPEKLLEEYK